MMSSSSLAARDKFRVQFNLILLPNLRASEDNNKGIEPLVTRKRRWVITDAKKKVLRDYYFNPVNGKPVHQYVQE